MATKNVLKPNTFGTFVEQSKHIEEYLRAHPEEVLFALKDSFIVKSVRKMDKSYSEEKGFKHRNVYGIKSCYEVELALK